MVNLQILSRGSAEQLAQPPLIGMLILIIWHVCNTVHYRTLGKMSRSLVPWVALIWPTVPFFMHMILQGSAWCFVPLHIMLLTLLKPVSLDVHPDCSPMTLPELVIAHVLDFIWQTAAQTSVYWYAHLSHNYLDTWTNVYPVAHLQLSLTTVRALVSPIAHSYHSHSQMTAPTNVLPIAHPLPIISLTTAHGLALPLAPQEPSQILLLALVLTLAHIIVARMLIPELAFVNQLVWLQSTQAIWQTNAWTLVQTYQSKLMLKMLAAHVL